MSMTNPSAGAGRDGRLQESWSVTVERNGESVVTLSSNMLAGRDLSAEDERVIRMAGEHLLAFIGPILAVPDPLASETNVWIVTEYEGGGIRGVFVSQGDAEAEIAAICSEHRDLTRSDFVIRIDRVRRGVPAPLASSSEPQGETKL